ncbi:MAG: alpha/beta hydrolase [Oscillospiraceae bacterium]|jgi:pimeloyl-ACP methyl ester carboxylesterase|nr:alpha/beta hydrolase [Oscillospiraceae bacterium]
MFRNAKNGLIITGDTTTDYIAFGKGEKLLILIPGLGDGVKTVKGMAIPLAWAYRRFVKDYRVFGFSRKNDVPDGYSTRDMAGDLAEAMEALGIHKASVFGVSQGGMIAQYLAIDYPDKVEKLVLTVTLAKQNETIQSVIGNWMKMASRGDYHGLMMDMTIKSYSDKYLKRNKFFLSFLGRVGKPKNFHRFLVQAEACLKHDAYAELDKISCPVLIVGGSRDHIVGSDAAPELAEAIENSETLIYEGLGHAAYEEAEDFQQQLFEFLS